MDCAGKPWMYFIWHSARGLIILDAFRPVVVVATCHLVHWEMDRNHRTIPPRIMRGSSTSKSWSARRTHAVQHSQH